MPEALVGYCMIDLVYTFTLLLFYSWMQVDRRRYEDLVWHTYLDFREHRPRPFTDYSERLLNVLLIACVIIYYMLYRLREYLSAQKEEYTRQQREYEDLFKLETNFMIQLRAHGVRLSDT